MRIITGALALAIKLGPKLMSVAGKAAKSAKGAKLGLAGASAASYAWLFTWEFAAAILIMLFVHESGHVWAMRRRGIPTKGFYFIPFVGGVAVPERAFASRWEEVYVAMMGPVWGGALALAALLAYWLTGHPLAAALAAWTAFLNIFNLLPINPLDGGRVVKSIVFSIHSSLGFAVLVLGMALAFVLMLLGDVLLLAIVLFFGLIDLGAEWKRRQDGPAVMTGYGAFLSAAWFVATLGVLIAVMWAVSGNPEADLALELLRD